VAEKNRFWRFAGNSARMALISSLKPMSSRRSASSSTKSDTPPSLTAFWRTRSSNGPGVATTMSAPPRKSIICGLIDTPPNSTEIFS
jgi:hypothetical protein